MFKFYKRRGYTKDKIFKFYKRRGYTKDKVFKFYKRRGYIKDKNLSFTKEETIQKLGNAQTAPTNFNTSSCSAFLMIVEQEFFIKEQSS